MKGTMIELVNLLLAKVEEDPTWASAEVEVDNLTITNLHTQETFSLYDEDEEDYWEDDVDESFYNPYMGEDDYSDYCTPFDEF